MGKKRAKRLIRTDEIEGGWPIIDPIVKGGEHLLDKVNVYIKAHEYRQNVYAIVAKLEHKHKHKPSTGNAYEYEPHEVDITYFDENTADDMPSHVIIRLRDSITPRNRVAAMALAIALTYDLVITFDADDRHESGEVMKFTLVPKEPYKDLYDNISGDILVASKFYEFLDEGA